MYFRILLGLEWCKEENLANYINGHSAFKIPLLTRMTLDSSEKASPSNEMYVGTRHIC